MDAIKYSVGGEIFVPKLNSFRIMDLIEILKEKNNAKNRIEPIGIRPGEKIHEVLINHSEIPRTFQFNNMYVIYSFIEKFKRIEKPVYIKKGSKVDESMGEYSSDNELLDKNSVKKLLEELRLI